LFFNVIPLDFNVPVTAFLRLIPSEKKSFLFASLTGFAPRRRLIHRMKIIFHWAKYMEIAGGKIWTVWRVLYHQLSVLDVDGLPDLTSSHIEVHPFLK